jgi:hypothetical protein
MPTDEIKNRELNTQYLNLEPITLYYKKSDISNGTDIRITYDSNIKELVFVDVIHNVVLSQHPLTQISEYNIIKPIIDNNFFKTKIDDNGQCKNCFSYTLIVSINNETNVNYWNEKTKGVENLLLISKELEQIANSIYG